MQTNIFFFKLLGGVFEEVADEWWVFLIIRMVCYMALQSARGRPIRWRLRRLC